jgi:hypothetical protein
MQVGIGTIAVGVFLGLLLFGVIFALVALLGWVVTGGMLLF